MIRPALSALLLFGLTATPALARSPHAARVEIARDAYGIPHIFGHSDADAVYGMIYAQAEDDFARIERNYLVALGRLAEAEGESAFWHDVRARMWDDEAELQRLYARAPAWLKTLMTAWAAGLNDYLADHPEVKPKVLTRFEPWMALSFTEGSIGRDLEQVNLDALRDFYAPALAKIALRDPLDQRGEPQGSNGIALAGSRTVSGRAMLLINPHTSFYFRAEQRVKSRQGLDVYGAVTWGQFFVYQGFNPDLGWMHPTTGADNVDEFAQTVRGNTYRYGRQWRPLLERPVQVRVRQPDGRLITRRLTTLATHHGPIVRRHHDGRPVAVALMDRPLEGLMQSYLWTKARTVAAYRRVGALQANSTNNTLLAARDGSIAFLMPQFMPRRDNRFDYRAPVDGADPRSDWRGLHPLSELPEVVNPASGYVQHSNDWPWNAAGPGTFNAARFPRYMDQAGERMRGRQGLARLAATPKFTAETLRQLAYHPGLPGFDVLIPPLLAAYDALPAGDPRQAALAAPIATLRGWNRQWSHDTRALALADRWGGKCLRRINDARPAHTPSLLDSQQYAGCAALDGDTLLALLSEAQAEVARDFGRWDVAWGDINRLQRIDNGASERFDDGQPSLAVPFASGVWGSYAVFGARRAEGQRRQYGTRGNSFVAIVEFGDRPSAQALMAGGQSGDPQSPHFFDQAALYPEGRLRPVVFTAAPGPEMRVRYRPGQRR